MTIATLGFVDIWNKSRVKPSRRRLRVRMRRFVLVSIPENMEGNLVKMVVRSMLEYVLHILPSVEYVERSIDTFLGAAARGCLPTSAAKLTIRAKATVCFGELKN